MRFHLGNLFEAYRSLENLDSGYLPYRSETSTDKKFISNTYRLINKKQYENFMLYFKRLRLMRNPRRRRGN